MLSILDTSTGKFINKPMPELNGSTIMKIEKDKRGNIWLGLYNGLIAQCDQDVHTTLFKDAYKNYLSVPPS